ncbi:MAG: hypothetical protein IH934_03340 [Nanoarchaeota archaeon]|nr:hypothetical protein [Nanoarchaeota archaeon]
MTLMQFPNIEESARKLGYSYSNNGPVYAPVYEYKKISGDIEHKISVTPHLGYATVEYLRLEGGRTVEHSHGKLEKRVDPRQDTRKLLDILTDPSNHKWVSSSLDR